MEETVVCFFIESKCYAKCTAILRNWCRIPFALDPLKTAEAMNPVAPLFLTLCFLLSQLRGAWFQPGWTTLPPVTAWSRGELGQLVTLRIQAHERWTKTRAEVFHPSQKPPLSHRMRLRLLFSAKLNFFGGTNARAIAKRGSISWLWVVGSSEFILRSLWSLGLRSSSLTHSGSNRKWTLSHSFLTYEVYLQV